MQIEHCSISGGDEVDKPGGAARIGRKVDWPMTYE